MAETPQALYQVAGDGRDEVTLLALRDRIRSGNLQPEDQVAIVGTDLWKPAREYAPLARYFSLVKPAPGVGYAAPRTPAAPMGSRIGRGLAYPFSSPASITFLVAGFAIALVFPLLSLVVALFNTVYALSVIRTSSEGQTSAPTFAQTGGVADWMMGLLRVIAVSLISAWPVILVMVFAFMGLIRNMVIGAAIAVIVMMLYYPASLATVAISRSIKTALSVQQIFRFIGVMGRHYYAVIGIFIVTAIVITFVTSLARSVVPRIYALDAAASLWLTIYVSHLLGWAIKLHENEM